MAEDLILSVTGAQINDAVTNGLDKNLSKLSATGKKILDGQWVYTNYAIENGGTWTAQTYDYDLSSYLPNDGYTYEVGFTAWASTLKGQKGFMAFIRPTNMSRSCALLCGASPEVTTTYTHYVSGNIILPVGSERAIKLGVLYNGVTAGSANLWCWGYRRVGTNE